jgi:hypothetical protein
MQRTVAIALCLSSLWAISIHAQEPRLHSEPEQERCANVKVLEPAKFAGRTLVEIPDVTAPEMRLANMLVSSSCLQEAASLLQEYVRSGGVDAQAGYVAARFVWRTRGDKTVEELLGQLLREYPSFVSLHVLLAGLRIEQGRLAEATEILDAAARSAPSDLWVYLDRLRIEAATDPTPERARVLIALLKDPRFPPNARLTAGDTVSHMHGGVAQEYWETIYKGMIAADVSGEDCMVAAYAMWLIDLKSRVDDARALLEKNLAGHEHCARHEDLRLLLAYTYLIEAADIAPTATAGNATWLQRMDKLLGGDYSAFADLLRNMPRAAELWPVVMDRLPPDTADTRGRTQLCNAIMALNVDAVRSQLERGADPDEDCDGNAPTWVVLGMKTREHGDERQGILRLLLEHGAKREVQPCRPWFSEDCETVFGPTLAEFTR